MMRGMVNVEFTGKITGTFSLPEVPRRGDRVVVGERKGKVLLVRWHLDEPVKIEVLVS